jgi:hypothetical protein
VQTGNATLLSAHLDLGFQLGSLVDWDLGRYSLSYGVSGTAGGFSIESDSVLSWPKRILNAADFLPDHLVDALPVLALFLDGDAGIKCFTRFRAGSLLLTDWESVEVDVRALWDNLGGNLIDSALSVSGLKRVVSADLGLVPLFTHVKSTADGFMTSGDIGGTAWGLSYHLPSPESLLLRYMLICHTHCRCCIFIYHVGNEFRTWSIEDVHFSVSRFSFLDQFSAKLVLPTKALPMNSSVGVEIKYHVQDVSVEADLHGRYSIEDASQM